MYAMAVGMIHNISLIKEIGTGALYIKEQTGSSNVRSG
jgi:hypothetical protein